MNLRIDEGLYQKVRGRENHQQGADLKNLLNLAPNITSDLSGHSFRLFISGSPKREPFNGKVPLFLHEFLAIKIAENIDGEINSFLLSLFDGSIQGQTLGFDGGSPNSLANCNHLLETWWLNSRG